MIKLMIIGRRASGISRSAAQRHLRDVHGRMVVCAPANAGAMPAGYIQNHVFDGAHYGAVGAHAIERDLVTELWFESIDHLRASTNTQYYLDNLKPDEPKFVDDSTVVKMMVRPRALKEGNGGEFKLLILITMAVDAAEPQNQIAPILLASRAIISAVVNEVLPPPDGQRPFVDIIYEAWFDARDAVEEALANVAPVISSRLIDWSRSLALIAKQYDTERLRALFS